MKWAVFDGTQSVERYKNNNFSREVHLINTSYT